MSDVGCEIVNVCVNVCIMGRVPLVEPGGVRLRVHEVNSKTRKDRTGQKET